MQYILTEKEYQDLKSEQKAKICDSQRQLQELCTKICNTMPVRWEGWDKDREPSPWGCILTAYDGNNEDWYCDNCPVQEICPYSHKAWSK